MSSEVHQDPLIGSLLDGRYHIVQRLGKGGMGNIYLAEETRLKRQCALKVLHPHLAEDRVHVERFLREAQTIAQLGHPNIVDIYAYGEEPSGVVWFAMEMLTGEDLEARGKNRKSRPFSIHDCCAWGVQIAQAVAVVHHAGLVHRDLKTSNIFLAQRRDGEEIVKLLDFGIARSEAGSELTATGVALGTPSYMSPEQVRNGVIDRRSDVYSFGMLLFKLLTGRLPFTGEAFQVAMAHCNQPVPAPSTLAPGLNISPELDALVLRATEKDPAARYQSMREVEEALVAILHAEAPELAPAVKVDRTGSQVRMRRVGEAGATGSVPAASLPDGATASSAALATSSTAVLEVPERGGASRWMYMTAGVGVLGLGAWLAISKIGDRDGREPVEPAVMAIAPTPAPESPAPEPEPVVEPASTPVSSAPVVAPAVRPASGKAKALYPLQQIERKAQSCRRKYKAVDGPTILVDYAVGMDGKVTRSVASATGELGDCLAAAVQTTQFEPKLVLGRKISL